MQSAKDTRSCFREQRQDWKSLMIFVSYYSAYHDFGFFQRGTTNHSPQPRKPIHGETFWSCMAAPEAWAQWIQECGILTHTPFLQWMGICACCCLLHSFLWGSVYFKANSLLFAGSRMIPSHCSMWQVNGKWVLLLFHFLGYGDSLSGDLKDFSSYHTWKNFWCTPSNPNWHDYCEMEEDKFNYISIN